jgi:hypothetical protein
MANQFARTLQNSVRVGKQRATVETEVDVAAIGHDVAKAVLERFAGERESDRDSTTFEDGFDRVGCLLKNYLAQGFKLSSWDGTLAVAIASGWL